MQGRKKICFLFSGVVLLLYLSICSTVYAKEEELGENAQADKAVIFVLDASGSMLDSDPDKLAVDSIAQLLSTLPSDYKTGFVAFSDKIVIEQAPVDNSQRKYIMEQAEGLKYVGYSNAGIGIKRAVELLSEENVQEKYIVFLSDGEVLMESDSTTMESLTLYEEAVKLAQKENIALYVIGLGEDMSDESNLISSLAGDVGGKAYYAPYAKDIQEVLDSILMEELKIKQMAAAIVDADGLVEEVTLNVPFTHASKIRILLTSDGAIKNLTTDFQAESASQMNGERYSLIEINRLLNNQIDIKFEGTAGCQVRILVIPEYKVIPMVNVVYEDVEPEDVEESETALFPKRTATISYSFVDSNNETIQLWSDEYFNHEKILVMENEEVRELTLNNGVLQYECPVESDEQIQTVFDFSRMSVNVIECQSEAYELIGPNALHPKEKEKFPWIWMVVAIGVILLLVIILIACRKKPELQPKKEEDKPEPGKYSFMGKLNIYITRTRSGYDIPPLTYHLFRLPAGKVLSLLEVLESCSVKEKFEGADKIYFKAGMGRNLILTNNSDCTVMKNREIMMKNKSYQLAFDAKVDIIFEDEISELTFQYKDLKPSEMR